MQHISATYLVVIGSIFTFIFTNCSVSNMFKQLIGTSSYFMVISHVEPTGLLIDSAMNLVLSCIPEVSIDRRREALVRASNHALMRGVTTVVDFGRYFPGASPDLPWEDFSGFLRILSKVILDVPQNIIVLLCFM